MILSPSLLVTFQAASEYQSESNVIPVWDQLFRIIKAADARCFLTAFTVVLNDKPCIVVHALGSVPEHTEQEITTVLSLPPGQLFEPHSDLISTLVLYQLRNQDNPSFHYDTSTRVINELGETLDHDASP